MVVLIVSSSMRVVAHKLTLDEAKEDILTTRFKGENYYLISLDRKNITKVFNKSDTCSKCGQSVDGSKLIDKRITKEEFNEVASIFKGRDC